jgi:transposase
VSFSCEVAIEPRAIAEESIGIDVGLQHFASFSNGQKIDNPRLKKRGKI